MAVLGMINGDAGTGKSTSIRTLSKEDYSLVNVSGKPLPFRGGSEKQTYNTDNYDDIIMYIKRTPKPIIIIDDATFLMTNPFMRNAKDHVRGYDQYNEIAGNFHNLIRECAKLPFDKTVYFLGHITRDEDGREHFKTIGKMLDNYSTVESFFSIVMKTVVKDGEYFFSTRNSGSDTVKTPMGMFESELIPNDLKLVDDTIRDYYGIQINKEGDNKND